ncbi:phosphotransferase [Erysipelothrix sp. HDW6C]|uniref:choline kinase family protein n=1 Tax=Erysipelothrix sp. HDW6C TaxID=2714930 RepID=UPI0014087EE6|nr:choline kinase family protein [Erysipelothrix sp. HDW6C]QIK70349.1 phosphotransferase [Erysipelothrix sp. HDW6C]
MKTIRTIKKAFKQTPLSEKFIPSGLTNNNYIVQTPTQKVVVRLPKPGNEALFNYAHEAIVLKMIADADLDAPTLYFDEKSGVKVSAYIDDAHVYNNSHIRDAARLIRRLHDLDVLSGESFDILAKYEMYKKRISTPLYNLEPYEDFIRHVAISSAPHTLCHNDLVQGNLLFTPDRAYLIDYEYAMDNDPFFDIMSFLTENDIQDPSLRETFYLAYFGETPTTAQRKRLHTFELAHHVLWCAWAQMMYNTHGDTIYYDIATLKYTRLLEAL